MPLRGLSYQVRIWERARKERPQAWLPLVIAVVVSHAPDGWTTSRSLEDMLDPAVRALPRLATLAPRFSLLIEDLTHLSDTDLEARSLAAFQKLALWLLRDARDPVRLLDSFGTWSSAMVELLSSPDGLDSFATLTLYMFRVVDPVHRTALRAKIRLLGPRAEEIAMTIAEQLIEEGRQEGRKEGREEGRRIAMTFAEQLIEEGREKGRQEGREEGRRIAMTIAEQLIEEGREKGRQEGWEEGLQASRIATLRRMLVFKFKLQTLDPAYEAQLQTTTPEAVDRYLERVLTADSLAAVFAD